MKKLLCVFSLFIFFLSNSIHAQVAPSIEWEKCFGGTNYDYAYFVLQTSDGRFLVAGSSESSDGDVSGNHGASDYWIIKLDSNGNLIWEKSIGGTSWDEAHSIFQTANGGYTIVGWSESIDGDVTGNHGHDDYWIVRLDASGEIVDQLSFGGSSTDDANSIVETSDGGFVVAGKSSSNDGDVFGNHGGVDYWVFKVKADGSHDWQKCFGGSDWDEAHSVVQTTDGGFIVVGWTSSNNDDVSGNHGGEDYWVVKLDTGGNLVWSRCYGGTKDDEAYAVLQASDGGFIVAGGSHSENDGDVTGHHSKFDYWIVKLDSMGYLLWQKCLGGSESGNILPGAGNDIAYSILETSDSSLVIAGYSNSYDGDVTGNHGWYDSWIVKLDFNGNVLWQKCMGGSDADQAHSIQRTNDGGYIVAGVSSSVDGDVSGYHGGTYAGDFWIMKLASDTETGIAPSSFNSISLNPNPVQFQLNINLATTASEVSIRVYDLQGRTINLPTPNVQSQTSKSIQLSTENLPAGFYTLQIINNKTGESEVGKFMKQD